LEVYKCGSCGCKWIPQAQVIKEPLFSAEKEGAQDMDGKAELEATIREATAALYKLEDKPRIQSPEDAGVLLGDMAQHEQEHLDVLLLNTRNEVERRVNIYKGSLNASSVRIGELFRDAVRDNTAAIIVGHNHPSGDPSPSPEDIGLTKEIVKAGKLLDIIVLDHLIIGHGRFISLKAKGLGFDAE
jgi:DNA repair protein RadC